MNITDLQQLLAASTYYKGAIDGDAGPATWAAIEIIERTSAHRYSSNPKRWSAKRRMIGAGQCVLDALQLQPGIVDGYAGHNTANALAAYFGATRGTAPDVIPRTPVPDSAGSTAPRSDPAQGRFPLQRELGAFYGAAGMPACTAGVVELPFTMRLSWNKRQTLKSFRCHERIADALTAVFRDALDHYGEAELRRLELDLFGGCYNYRSMRGGSALSTHAYGAAIDLNPDKNQLRWGADRAQFARAEYEPFLRIVMAHGGTPAGYAWGRDWMHLQWARLD